MDLPDLRARVECWLSRNPAQTNLFVIGGGEVVEAMRALDQVHGFPSKQVHWWCVHLLETTAKLAAELLPSLKLIAEVPRIVQLREEPLDAIVQVRSFYPELASANPPLPETWETTTDSIAALLAVSVGADELVLLKSREPQTSQAKDRNGNRNGQGDIENWRVQGLVDDAFPLIARKIASIRIVDLRKLQVECSA